METASSPLAVKPVGGLILQFAIPAIISNLISALYNIVDQIFIGRSEGLLGNAATNVAFPLVTLCLSISLLLGIGGASNYSLAMGRGETEKAERVYGAALGFLVLFGLSIGVLVRLFLKPLLVAFGATEAALPLALIYTGITAYGMPFYIFATAGSHLIRANGSPKWAMASITTGAVMNLILDPLLIFGFDMGIAGAAWATVAGQVASALIQLFYFLRYKPTLFRWRILRPHLPLLTAIAGLGAASFFNQVAMMLVQIAMNNTLRTYGALSPYGSDIPIACVGIITKVNVMMMAFLVGIAQGCQPIIGYNYGAQQYPRVREAFCRALLAAELISCGFFLCFQLFPRQILAIFDREGSEMFFQFGARYFRVYMAMAFMTAVHPLTSSFFTSIGKARRGMLLSLTRQIIFLLPLIFLFSRLFGIDGVMFAGPIADGVAVALAVVLLLREMGRMRSMEQAKKEVGLD